MADGRAPGTADARPPWVLLGNGSVARAFLRETVAAGHPPVLLVLNAAERQREGPALQEAASTAGVPAAAWSPETAATLGELAAAQPGLWLVSVYFGHVLHGPVLALVNGRAVNLHASLLPWNRGVHTNVWPIVDRSPAGVSLHAMVAEVDAGPVLAQAPVIVEAWDTGATLYSKLEVAALELLVRSWPRVVLDRWPGVAQEGEGSSHRLTDFARLAEYDLDGHPEARAFFDLLRARSFPPHGGLVVRVDGVAVEAQVSLKEVRDE